MAERRVPTPRSELAVGIALSSGGAAGLAHVGVVEELVAAGIPLRVVAGTSAGAMVGAAFAAGHLAAFRDTVTSLTRRRVLSLFDPRWPHSGLLEGRRPLEIIRPHVGDRIETLDRPYAAVATDLATGAEVVMREGPVLEAIRASVAIPGLLTPQVRDGHFLVDGGLVNPVPVDVARSLGADFVIAVSVLSLPHTSVRGARDGQGVAGQLFRRLLARFRDVPPSVAAGRDERGPDPELGLISILSKASRVVQTHIATGRLREHPPDHLILVDLPEIGLFDFHRASELIAAGRAAARDALPALEAALAAAAPLTHKVARWIDDASARLRRSEGNRVGRRRAPR